MKSFLRSSAANGINFIDKQNRRRIFSCNRKYSVHGLRSLPDPFADKLIEAGSLSWPRTTEEAADLTEEQFDYLMLGLNPLDPKIKDVTPQKPF